LQELALAEDDDELVFDLAPPALRQPVVRLAQL
jgi:hypothetical protein